MAIIRLVAALLTNALLCGAACVPVHSDRPMGETPLDLSKSEVAWNGVWCTYNRAGAPLEDRVCWVASVADEASGVVALNRLAERKPGQALEVVNLHVRVAPASLEGAGTETKFIFLSEEDTVLRGTYLWALARASDEDLLLVWMTDVKRDSFVDLVVTGRLPGRILKERLGRSGVFDMMLSQTVILGDLKEEHLRLIIERRGELFDLVPMILRRLPPTEP